MGKHTYQQLQANDETRNSLLLGAAFAFGLFILMALAQMMGNVAPPSTQIDEIVMAFTPPDVLELEDEPPPPEEEEEPPPELKEDLPLLSLDQLDIALNPGTGGSLAGDFAMPIIGTTSRDLGTEDFVDFSDLDQLPRPIGVTGFNFPPRLKRKKVSGRIVLFVKLDESGEVLDAQLDSSTLPEFSDFVVKEVRRWKFTAPTREGRAVKAQARFPIPVTIN